ncbi:MAG: AAA family ATPase [Aureispira sp.]
MLEGIHIKNFRCFEDFQLEGFGQVNLIGGLNNSGKTVLLEGIFLGDTNPFPSIPHLKIFRYNNNESWVGDGSFNDWNDLFYNKQPNQTITIEHGWASQQKTSLSMSFQLEEISNTGKLSLVSCIDDQLYAKAELEAKHGSHRPSLDIIQPTETAIKPLRKILIGIQSTGTNLQPTILAKHYSQFELLEQDHHILEAVQTIDPSITALKVIVVGQPNLYAQRANEPLLPIEFFGDAITKLVRVVIGLLRFQNGIILIDEIENGIHYSNQEQVWELIFKWAKQFNVQVFATTHSKEMANAFNKIALEQEENTKACYIEMARHYKTNKIIGTVMPPDILQHKIENNQAFRGE